MFEFFLETELIILNFLQLLRCSFFDSLFVFITHLGDKGMLWILMGLCLCLTPKYKRAGFCVLLALLINFVICNITLKPLIARTRPYEYVEGIKLLINRPKDFSFPSGHSSSSFAAAFSVWFYNKKWGRMSLVIASFIAFSRLYLHVHFPTDVVFGIMIGIFSSFTARYLISKMNLH
jgi:undecaprenyl-diphosphatase